MGRNGLVLVLFVQELSCSGSVRWMGEQIAEAEIGFVLRVMSLRIGAYHMRGRHRVDHEWVAIGFVLHRRGRWVGRFDDG